VKIKKYIAKIKSREYKKYQLFKGNLNDFYTSATQPFF